MSENYEDAENDYMLGMKYKEIAEKYGVTVNTVKSWKQRYGWQKAEKEGAKKYAHKNAHKMQKVCIQNEGVFQAAGEGETEGGLDERKRLFCIYFVKYRNQVKAYQKAYQCSYETACSNAYKVWKNMEVQEEIKNMLESVRNSVKIDILDLIRKQIDIMNTDIHDFVEIEKGFVEIKPDMDGTLVKEIKNTRYGVAVKLYDKQKAIDWMGKNIGDVDLGQKETDNMQTLADILLNPKPDRDLTDFEEEDADEHDSTHE